MPETSWWVVCSAKFGETKSVGGGKTYRGKVELLQNIEHALEKEWHINAVFPVEFMKGTPSIGVLSLSDSLDFVAW